jgi:hypothetical protein
MAAEAAGATTEHMRLADVKNTCGNSRARGLQAKAPHKNTKGASSRACPTQQGHPYGRRQHCVKYEQAEGGVLHSGVIMLTCIPSARDACEHDYSRVQQNVPSQVDVPTSSQRFPNLTGV